MNIWSIDPIRLSQHSQRFYNLIFFFLSFAFIWFSKKLFESITQAHNLGIDNLSFWGMFFNGFSFSSHYVSTCEKQSSIS